MKTTIDKAGRVVIPAVVRRRAGLKSGTKLEVAFVDGVIQISRDTAKPVLEKRAGRWIARPSEPLPQDFDIAQQVAEERDRWPW